MNRFLVALGVSGFLLAHSASADAGEPPGQVRKNPTGQSATHGTTGAVDHAGAFFQSFGTNGRTCGTCHLAGDGWGLSVRSVQALFDQAEGDHALFEHDGQNCPGADRSTVEARRAASSLLLERGLIRLDLPLSFLPPEFELVAWEGTSCNVVTPASIPVYRRPPPVANFDTLTTVGWSDIGQLFGDVPAALAGSAVVGTQLHAQTPYALSPSEIDDIVGFMTSLFSAQIHDDDAKELTARGALGGPENLSALPADGDRGFNLFDTWRDVPGGGTEAARRAVVRGQDIFNARCARCHSSPNRGSSAVGAMFNLGLADAARRPPDLPLYTYRNLATGETVQVSDPGLAGITGRWADIGRFKVPGLRGLAARAPYFHNGLAATLEDVVDFYDARFRMGLSDDAKADLVRFLRAL